MVSSYGPYHIEHNGCSLQSNDKLLVVSISLQEQGKHGLTVGPTVFPAKMSRSLPEGSTDDIICPPHAISCHFLATKPPVLWVAGSLLVDVDLVGTNLGDVDSLLDYGLLTSF